MFLLFTKYKVASSIISLLRCDLYLSPSHSYLLPAQMLANIGPEECSKVESTIISEVRNASFIANILIVARRERPANVVHCCTHVVISVFSELKLLLAATLNDAIDPKPAGSFIWLPAFSNCIVISI